MKNEIYEGTKNYKRKLSKYERLLAFTALIISDSRSEIIRAYSLLNTNKEDNRSCGKWLCTLLERDGVILKE